MEPKNKKLIMEFRKILPKKCSVNVERYSYLSNQELKEIIDQFDIFFQLVLQLHLFMPKNSKSVELSNMITKILSRKESVQFMYNLTPVKVYLNDFNIYRQHMLRTLKEKERKQLPIKMNVEDSFWKKIYDKILEKAREVDVYMDLPKIVVNPGAVFPREGKHLEEAIEEQIETIAKKKKNRELGFDDDGCIANKEIREEYIKIRIEEDVCNIREVEVCQYELELWKKEIFFEFYPQSSILQAPVLETYDVLHTISKLPGINNRDKTKFLKLLTPLFSKQYIPIFHKKGLKISTSYKFSHLDDCLLLMGLNRFGTKNFGLVQNIFLPHKTVNEIKNRYKNCTRFKSIHNIIKHWKYKQTIPLTRLEEINFEKARRWFGYNNYNLIQKYFLPNRNCRFLKLNFENDSKLLGKRSQMELSETENRKIRNDINFELFRLNYPQERTRLAIICEDKEYQKKQMRIYNMMSDTIAEKPTQRRRRKKRQRRDKRPGDKLREPADAQATQKWKTGVAEAKEKKKKSLNKIQLLDKRYFKKSKAQPQEKRTINVQSSQVESKEVWVLQPTIEELDQARSLFLSKSPNYSESKGKFYEIFDMN